MKQQLTLAEIMALGFMTFALFLGAGNIIFPALAGLKSGAGLWQVAAGFLITGVGLPLLTVVALARMGGGLDRLTLPVGRLPGRIFAVVVYLAIGPMFATPRTAVVSYEIGMVPFFSDSGWALLVYSALYFALVFYLALHPGRMLERIGQLITPVLLLALAVLGAAAVFKPAGAFGPGLDPYSSRPVVQGFLDGYLTMDALGALAFGVVIAASIRSRGVTARSAVTRYSIYAGLIAAAGMAFVYLSLFYLGAGSYSIASDADNGGQILARYVAFAFGDAGNLLLAVVITLACITTATGLLVACAEFFQQTWGWRYRRSLVLLVLFSWAVSNQGLTQLIKVSVPVLIGLYPLAIVLVGLSFMRGWWHKPRPVWRVTLAVALVFGVLDMLVAAGAPLALDRWPVKPPLMDLQLAWLVPVLVTLLIMGLRDHLRKPRSELAQ